MAKCYIPQEQLDAYKKHLEDDYNKGANEFSPGKTFSFEPGSKYIRVVGTWGDGQRSSHSFIVQKDTKRFRKGTILKCATWHAPALNFARGYIDMPGTYQKIRWSGC